jgi:hypothetical protein
MSAPPQRCSSTKPAGNADGCEEGSEIRMPKTETRSKPEVRRSKPKPCFGWIWQFGPKEHAPRTPLPERHPTLGTRHNPPSLRQPGRSTGSLSPATSSPCLPPSNCAPSSNGTAPAWRRSWIKLAPAHRLRAPNESGGQGIKSRSRKGPAHTARRSKYEPNSSACSPFSRRRHFGGAS